MRALAFALLAALAGCGTSSYCMTDADCRLISDYCQCTCRAGRASDPNPTCSEPKCVTVQDICANRTAVCVANACTAR